MQYWRQAEGTLQERRPVMFKRLERRLGPEVTASELLALLGVLVLLLRFVV